jgi:choline monooxygenase
MGNKFYIDSDIKKAETLPASFYKDEQIFKELKEKIFLKSWHYIGDENLVALPQSVYPLVLLDNYLTEPILIVRNEDDKINCFTNVCTHRGNLVALQPGKVKKLTCMYHGRRFSLNGEFE